jgi:hypothetical protein
MNDRTAGAVLLVIGVVAIFAAIVGGGIKIQQIEVGSVQSKWRQWLLAGFGLVIAVVGLTMVLPDSDPDNNVADIENASETNAAEVNGDDQQVVEPGTEDNSTVDANAGADDGAGTDENSLSDQNAAE